MKPITKDRFQKSLDRLNPLSNVIESKSEIKRKKDFIYVNVDRRLVKVSIPSIYLIEAKGDYINMKIENKNYMVHSTLRKIEDKLHLDSFLK
nr:MULTISPECIES: LytTR family transcriptional regulator DNA-binding domain-containing protein [unclassified Polaribacter]